MPATQRRPAPGVIDRLLAEPYRFEFFQAVHLLELWLRQNGVPPDAPLDYLRFRNRLSLAFPPSQIAALAALADAPVDSAEALLAALREQRLVHIDITPAFIGFLGSNGTLPLHYTQRLATQELTHNDDGPRAFLDLFSHRSATLFYQAWTMHRPEHMRDADGNDGLLPILLALAGVQPPARPDGTGIADETMAHYASQFRSRAVSASAVTGVLADYFGVPFELEQFVGHWQPLLERDLSRLGVANNRLGSIVLGRRIFSRDKRVRLRIGPLSQADFERFLPRSSGAHALKAMLAQFCGVGMTVEVRLIVRRQDVRPFTLGTSSARLGLGAFLGTRPEIRDRDGAGYLLQP